MKRVGRKVREREACDSLRKRHPLWGSAFFRQAAAKRAAQCGTAGAKRCVYAAKVLRMRSPSRLLRLSGPSAASPLARCPGPDIAHAGREAQGRFQFSERDAAGIVELVPAQESAYRMERVFGFHGGLHIAEALRTRAEFRPCGENPGHGVLLPVDLQLLAQDHESPRTRHKWAYRAWSIPGFPPDAGNPRGVQEPFRGIRRRDRARQGDRRATVRARAGSIRRVRLRTGAGLRNFPHNRTTGPHPVRSRWLQALRAEGRSGSTLRRTVSLCWLVPAGERAPCRKTRFRRIPAHYGAA